MSAIDEVLEANEEFSADFRDGGLARRPGKKLAVITCMDARLDVFSVMGLEKGDACVIRNAGGIVSDDAIRSLVIACELLGVEEVMVVNHTDCGMLTFTDEELRGRLIKDTGAEADAPRAFHAFSGLEENVREQVRKIKKHPWIPAPVTARGFVYDVGTGKLTEVDG
ncbi:MAG: beta-class carbonic anhydrase [Candidatus Nitrospinota bacterium M3_3B_026]